MENPLINKPFFLFAGHNYYPEGGWEDFAGAFESIDKAKDHFAKPSGKQWPGYMDNWCHVVDIATGKIVARFEQHFLGKVSDHIPGPIVAVDKDGEPIEG